MLLINNHIFDYGIINYSDTKFMFGISFIPIVGSITTLILLAGILGGFGCIIVEFIVDHCPNWLKLW